MQAVLTSAAQRDAKVTPASHGFRVMISLGRAVAGAMFGYTSAAITPSRALANPTGSISTPPQRKPFCAVRTSLAPREI